MRRTYTVWGVCVLSAIDLIIASTVLAQSPLPVKPYQPPPTNIVPAVRIITPMDGTLLLAPVDLHICAAAAYFTDAVASVEFLAGTNILGVVTNGGMARNGHEMWRVPNPAFCLTWTNVPPGDYALTAIATDLAGNNATSAVVDISVVTNLPPKVFITKPHDGAIILGPTNLNLCASAFDPDHGTVTQVEFFQGATSLGVVSNVPPFYITNKHGAFPVKNTSYCLVWSNAPPGAYTLTAVATDNDGAMTTSEPADISVVSNLPPRVRLENPYDDAKYFAPATVTICAAAKDPDGTIKSVEFFAGTNSLGLVTNSVTVTNHEGIHALYCFTWSGVTTGAYALTAVATDNGGAAATSKVVDIRVVSPPPPSVKITSPSNGATFLAPARIAISSSTRYFPDAVARVQYFSGATSLGVVTNGPGFRFYWTNVPPGAYSLTAKATDLAGTITATSLPVNITVKTNRPPPLRR